MSPPFEVSVDWDGHPRCTQCDDTFHDGEERVAGLLDMTVVGVFHRACVSAFEIEHARHVPTVIVCPKVQFR